MASWVICSHVRMLHASQRCACPQCIWAAQLLQPARSPKHGLSPQTLRGLVLRVLRCPGAYSLKRQVARLDFLLFCGWRDDFASMLRSCFTDCLYIPLVPPHPQAPRNPRFKSLCPRLILALCSWRRPLRSAGSSRLAVQLYAKGLA